MSKSKRIPVPARRTGHSVFATIAFEDGTVRMTSTHEFFCKQMRWSAHVVQDYWHKVIHTQKGVWPSEVPTTVRFCLTWIVGIDCTSWTPRQIHGWMNRKLGADGSPMATVYMTWAYRPDPRPLTRTYVPMIVSHTNTTDVRLPPPRTRMRLNLSPCGSISPMVVQARVSDLPATEEVQQENELDVKL